MKRNGRCLLRRLSAALCIVIALAPVAGLSGGAAATAAAPVPRTDAAGTVWLCRPGLANDPCTADLDTTVVRADGSLTTLHVTPAADPAFDCFYVYPTVSPELRMNADLAVQPVETAAAIAQASRFSQYCRVWAPMYRQRTLLALVLGGAQADAAAYQSLLAGWSDYLAHYNAGRPIIFIGHSQGATLLIKLLQSQVDAHPALRRRMISAILLGGNVVVPVSAGASGSFQHIPPCRTGRQTGCVIAYSSFPGQPPPGSLFGRPGMGVSTLAGQTATTALQVLCVNPATLNGGSGALDPYFPTADVSTSGQPVTTPWVEYPNLYTASCKSAGGASWLNVRASSTPDDTRPLVTAVGGAIWGYHVADVNLALGNLVSAVAAQERAYTAAAR